MIFDVIKNGVKEDLKEIPVPNSSYIFLHLRDKISILNLGAQKLKKKKVVMSAVKRNGDYNSSVLIRETRIAATR